MPKVSVNILTKNRISQLKKCIESVFKQTTQDFEVVVVNDGSTDKTKEYLETLSRVQIINHKTSLGITQSRMEALNASKGEYIAILDDDDEWLDANKLKKQVEFLDAHPEYVLAGGSIQMLGSNHKALNRPKTDQKIRNQMLLKNPFFTSTVMFRKETALKAGGFVKDEVDLAEDYDLWLRMGRLGKMYNFQEVFTKYAKSEYNKEKFKAFFLKQLKLVKLNSSFYKHYWLSSIFLKIRLKFLI